MADGSGILAKAVKYSAGKLTPWYVLFMYVYIVNIFILLNGHFIR